MMTPPKKVQLRAQVPPDIDFLMKSVIIFLNDREEWLVGDAVTEASAEWLQKPKIWAKIEEHGLLKAMNDKGIELTSFEVKKSIEKMEEGDRTND